MVTRRQTLAILGATLAAGCSSESTDATPTTGRPTETATETAPPGESPGTAASDGAELAVSIPAFAGESSIPERYTADGEDVSPRIVLDAVPSGAETLALVVDDPDAGGFVHWLLWNVPADVEALPEGVPQEETVPPLSGARQGTNDFGELGYRGPSPPESDGPHTYRFQMTAVDITLGVEAGASRESLQSAFDGQRIDDATLTATYDR